MKIMTDATCKKPSYKECITLLMNNMSEEADQELLRILYTLAIRHMKRKETKDI